MIRILIASELTIEVTGVDNEAIYCPCRPQSDDCPVITEMKFPRDRLSDPHQSEAGLCRRVSHPS